MQTFFYKRDGKLTNPKVIRKAFDDLADGSYSLTIENKKKRSNNQNAYLHGVLIPIVFQGLRDAGFDDVKTHDHAKLIIKALFLKRQIVNHKTGEVIETIGKTSELTTTEFNQLIEEIQKWGAEYLSVTIPSPGENIEIWT